MQETTKIKLKRNLEIGMKVSFAIGVFSAIGFNHSDLVLLFYIGLSGFVIGSILVLIYFLRPRTEDEQEKARNSIVVKLLRAGMVIVLIYGVISFPKELIKELISAILI
jgi:hypothetical protein